MPPEAPGTRTALAALSCVADPRRRGLLESLVYHSGLAGAPALTYMARLLAYRTGDGAMPSQPAKLRSLDRKAVERHVDLVLERLAGDPRLRRPTRRRTA